MINEENKELKSWLESRKNQLSELRAFSVPFINEIDGLFISIDRGSIYANNVLIGYLDGKNGAKVFNCGNDEDQSVIDSIFDGVYKRLQSWIDGLFTSHPIYDLQTHGLVECANEEATKQQFDRLKAQSEFRGLKKKLVPKVQPTLEEKIKKEEDRRATAILKRQAAKALISSIKGKY